MTFEIFLLFAGSLGTIMSAVIAYMYMRSEKKSSTIPETPVRISTTDREDPGLRETKVDIKIVGDSITLTAQDIDAETLERVLESLNVARISLKKHNDVSRQRRGEEEKEEDVKLSSEL